MASSPVQIPASWVNAGQGIPTCCAAHGNAPTVTKKLALMSRPPAWSYLLLLLSPLVFAIGVMILRKTATAPAWPFCEQCAKQRTTMLITGWGLLAAMVLCWVVAASGVPGGVAGLLALLSFVFLMAGMIVAIRGGWRFQSHAEVSGDGTWVLVRKADPAFEQQVAATTAAANQQYTGQVQQ